MNNLAEKFVDSLSKQLLQTPSIHIESKETLTEYLNVVFNDLSHKKLKDTLIESIDEYTEMIWTKICANKVVPVFSESGFVRAAQNTKDTDDLLSLCSIPSAPASVVKQLYDSLLDNPIENQKQAIRIFSFIMTASNANFVSTSNHIEASRSLNLLLNEMATVYNFILKLPSNWISYNALASYANLCITTFSQSMFVNSPQLYNTTAARRYQKMFSKRLICIYSLVLRSIELENNTISETDALNFLMFVSLGIERIPRNISHLSLNSLCLDLVEFFLLNITLDVHNSNNPDYALLLRVGPIVNILLRDLLARDPISASSPYSPLNNALSALRVARIVRSFTALSTTMKKATVYFSSKQDSIATTEDDSITINNVKSAVIYLGKMLQKAANTSGSIPLPSTILPSLPSLLAFSLKTPSNPKGTLSDADKHTLGNISKDTFSFLLRSGSASITNKAIDKLIRKLLVEGKSVLQNMAKYTMSLDEYRAGSKEKEEDVDEGDEEMGLPNLDKMAKKKDFKGMSQFLLDSDDEDEDSSLSMDLANADARDFEDDDDLFYEDVDGDTELRENLNELISQAKEDTIEMEKRILIEGELKQKMEEDAENSGGDDEDEDDDEVKSESGEDGEVKDESDDDMIMFNDDDDDEEEEVKEESSDEEGGIFDNVTLADTDLVKLPKEPETTEFDDALKSALASTIDHTDSTSFTKRGRHVEEEEEVVEPRRRRSTRLSSMPRVSMEEEKVEPITPKRRSTRLSSRARE